MIWLFLLLSVWMVLLVVADGYDLRVAANRLQITRRIVFATFVAGALYLLIFFLFARPVAMSGPIGATALFNLDPPLRLVPLFWLLLALPLLIIWRYTYIQLFTVAGQRRRAIIVGATEAGIALAREMRAATNDYEFIGFIEGRPDQQGAALGPVRVLGDETALLRLVKETKVDEVIVAFPPGFQGGLFQALTYCHEQGINIRPITQVYEDVFGQVAVEHLGPYWFLNASNSKYPTLYTLCKRLMDIAVGLVGVTILLIALPFIALAIYLDNPGNIFYRQERSGKGGKIFWVLKFRSMVMDAEKLGQAQWAAKNDPRITRVGRFMRRVRLDELPQFINILQGDMSIVGPRPERPQFVEQLEQQIPFYRARLSVKPGLTGWAQVRYRYGSTVEDALMKLKYDLYYIKNQSVLLDLFIICKTVAVVLAFRGT